MSENTYHGRPEELARRCASLMMDKKARDIVLLDVRGLTDIADFFVLCSCDSDVHVKAVAENVRDELAREGLKAWRTEGWQGMSWVIVDYVEVVVHVFYHETRHFYKLERLWADARIEHITEEV